MAMFSLIGKASALVTPHPKPIPGDAPLALPRVRSDELRTMLERVHLAADELDVVGRDTEAVRNRCSDIIAKVNNLATLEDDLYSVFDQVSVLLRELEQAKTDLTQRNAVLAVEREGHAELKARFKTTHDENQARRDEIDVLRKDSERLRAARQRAEERIEQLEKDARMQAEILATTEEERQYLHERLAYANEELKASQDSFRSLDDLVSGLQSDLAAERHRTALTEQNLRSAQTMLAESQQQAARLKTDLDDSNLGWTNTQQTVAALEAEQVKLQAELAQIRGLWQQEADAHATDVAGLRAEIESAESLAKIADALLSESRAEVQTQLDKLRQEERRAQEATTKVSLLEQRLQSAEAANADFVKRVAEVESARDALLERIKPLVKRVDDQDVEIGKLRQQADALQARLAAETARFEGERERMEGQINVLTEGLEKERAMKALAEGALRADRRERAQLQQALNARGALPATPENPEPSRG